MPNSVDSYQSLFCVLTVTFTTSCWNSYLQWHHPLLLNTLIVPALSPSQNPPLLPKFFKWWHASKFCMWLSSLFTLCMFLANFIYTHVFYHTPCLLSSTQRWLLNLLPFLLYLESYFKVYLLQWILFIWSFTGMEYSLA